MSPPGQHREADLVVVHGGWACIFTKGPGLASSPRWAELASSPSRRTWQYLSTIHVVSWRKQYHGAFTEQFKPGAVWQVWQSLWRCSERSGYEAVKAKPRLQQTSQNAGDASTKGCQPRIATVVECSWPTLPRGAFRWQRLGA